MFRYKPGPGVTVDYQFTQPHLAELYDAFCAGRPDFPFYLPLVMSAHSVLDVGCGTGELLRLAREAGHTGRLYGLDPANAMLDVARRRDDVDWFLGDPTAVRWQRDFELIVMTGHAFQVWVGDELLRESLASLRSALTDDGRFIFETRNPLVREWERWSPLEVEHNGTHFRMDGEGYATKVAGQLVTFTSRFTSSAWDVAQLSQSTLRFLDNASLVSFLKGAGLAIDEQFGDWDRSPLSETSPEIITVARRC